MIIFPAIDLYEGRAVRLLKGDYSEMQVYSDDPVSVGMDFVSCGAKHVHLVDLEGARDGTCPNLSTVLAIRSSCGLFCEICGGIRSMETIDTYLGEGLDRVILGTAALNDRDLLERAVSRYPGRIAVGADIRDGYLSVKGWTEDSSVHIDGFIADMISLGVETVIVTDISKDGAMQGTNRELYQRLCKQGGINITASGGVSDLGDVAALKDMGLYGAIIGKAYYTGAIDLRKALEVAHAD